MIGETYIDENGDIWIRVPPFGCWEREKDRIKHDNLIRAAQEARHDKRNANRVAHGKRMKSPSEFRRSAARYDQYLREDPAESFGEWLRGLKHRRRW